MLVVFFCFRQLYIWYDTTWFHYIGYVHNEKVNATQALPPPFRQRQCQATRCACPDLTLSCSISTKPYYYFNRTIHGSLSYLPDNVVSMFVCGSLHDISILPQCTHTHTHFSAFALECNVRPFRQLKVKYYSSFHEVLNYIYSNLFMRIKLSKSQHVSTIFRN